MYWSWSYDVVLMLAYKDSCFLENVLFYSHIARNIKATSSTKLQNDFDFLKKKILIRVWQARLRKYFLIIWRTNNNTNKLYTYVSYKHKIYTTWLVLGDRTVQLLIIPGKANAPRHEGCGDITILPHGPPKYFASWYISPESKSNLRKIPLGNLFQKKLTFRRVLLFSITGSESILIKRWLWYLNPCEDKSKIGLTT